MALIQTFELRDEITGEDCIATLYDCVNVTHRQDLEVKWVESLDALKSLAPPNHREASGHWDWSKKLAEFHGMFGRQEFVIECKGTAQSVMLIDLNRTSRMSSTKGESIVYVDYLQSAPWNWKRPWRPHRPFRGLGTIMLQVAVRLSIELGFEGRVGLHSLEDAEDFYRKHPLKELWRDPDYFNLMYFEMTTEQSSEFLDARGVQ